MASSKVDLPAPFSPDRQATWMPSKRSGSCTSVYDMKLRSARRIGIMSGLSPPPPAPPPHAGEGSGWRCAPLSRVRGRGWGWGVNWCRSRGGLGHQGAGAGQQLLAALGADVALALEVE